jgi:mono/diheme cytochrome c family protein
VLLTITTTGKVTLVIVAGAFIAWALITAIWIPKRNSDFPVTLTAFVLVSALFFMAQMGSVYWVTSTQEVETEAVEGGGAAATTPAATTPAETTTGETPQAGADADVVAGKEVFATAGCVSCHTLADAGATGTVGPNLDQAKPPSALVMMRVTNGKGVMPSFKGQLTEQQIKDVAAYVSSVAGSS